MTAVSGSQRVLLEVLKAVPSTFGLFSEVKKRKKELEDTTWTVKDLGGRQLDGAEGPPPGFVAPKWMPAPVNGTPLGYVSPGKYRAPVKAKETMNKT